MKSSSTVYVKIVPQVPVLEDMLPNLAGVHPGDKVLHVAGDEEGGVQHRLRAHPHMTALHQRHGALDALGHLAANLTIQNMNENKCDISYFYAVLWIRNDLFRIRIQL